MKSRPGAHRGQASDPGGSQLLNARRAATVIALLSGALFTGCGSPPQNPAQPTAPSRPLEPLDLAPADALLCWVGRPYETVGDSTAPSPFQTLIDATTRIAGSPLRPRDQFALRSLEMFTTVVNHPFALIILDAQARPTDNNRGRRVDKLQLALVAQTGGKSEPFIRNIQKTVNELTDSRNATLQERPAGRYRFHQLDDKRLEETIAWGEIDGCFAITYGPDVWPRLAAAAEDRKTSLPGDRWVAGVRENRASPPLIEVFSSFRRIRDRLDPHVEGRATRFFEAWQAQNVDQGYWALGFEGRALYCTGAFRQGDETARRIYADPTASDATILGLIPEPARYAVYRIPVGDLLPQIISGYYATRSRRDADRAAERWRQIQVRYQFDAERDLLSQLGDTIILHNDPPHPLRLPLAFTGLLEIRGNARRVAELVDQACEAWSRVLEGVDGEDDDEKSWLRLERSDDGIWSLEYGPVAGLAWTITERYIVTCWSPAALREYLRKVGDNAGRWPLRE